MRFSSSLFSSFISSLEFYNSSSYMYNFNLEKFKERDFLGIDAFLQSQQNMHQMLLLVEKHDSTNKNVKPAEDKCVYISPQLWNLLLKRRLPHVKIYTKRCYVGDIPSSLLSVAIYYWQAKSWQTSLFIEQQLQEISKKLLFIMTLYREVSLILYNVQFQVSSRRNRYSLDWWFLSNSGGIVTFPTGFCATYWTEISARAFCRCWYMVR